MSLKLLDKTNRAIDKLSIAQMVLALGPPSAHK